MTESARQFDQPTPAGNTDSPPPGRDHLREVEDKHAAAEEPSFYKKGQTAGRQELSESEHSGSGFHYVPTKNTAPASKAGTKAKPHKRGLSGWNRRRKLLAGLGGAGFITAGLVAFLLSVLPFELIHLKHVVTDDIGGTQARTYRIGRSKLYSTMFFFDANGKYSGQKVTGIRRLMQENRSTKKMVSNLKKNGYEIHFDDQGRVTALNKVDSDGKVLESYKSNDTLLRAWSIKDPEALPSILREVYPDKSDFWYNRATAQMNRRLGLTRTNWLREQFAEKSGLNAANRKVGAVEERFVRALRQKLFGASEPTTPGAVPTDKNGSDADKQQQAEANSRYSKFVNAASALKQKLLGDPSQSFTSDAQTALNLNGGDINQAIEKSFSGGAVAKDISGSILNGLNLARIPQTACTLNGDLNTIEMGARTLQAAQLIKFTYAFATMADAAQDGRSVDTDQVNALMQYFNSKDANGNTMFNSSGYQYWTNPASRGAAFTGVDANERDKYSVGGGFVGALASIRQTLQNRWHVSSSCNHINNPFVTVFGFVAGGVSAFFTAGSSVLVNIGAQIGVGMFFNFANSLIVGQIVPVVAGTVVNGSETGTAVGNAFISGGEALVSATGANAGMYPLTPSQYAGAESAYLSDQKTELARTSLIARLFSPQLDHSLTTVATTAASGFSLSKLADLPSGLMHFVGSFGGLFNKPVLAASNACPDQDIQKAGVMATPFCNIIVGIPDSILNNPAYAPDKLDDLINAPANTNGTPNVDDDGQPVEGSKYADYLKNCTADDIGGDKSGAGLDLIHTHPGADGNQYHLTTNQCHDAKYEVFNLYRFYMMIAQSENDVLNDNLPSDDGSPVPDTSDPTQASSQTINTGDLYKDSADVACAFGTKDLGTQTGYTNGQPVKIRVCAIPGFRQNNTSLEQFGVVGTDGNIAVNSRVSGAVMALFNAAKLSGLTLSANSSFRTMAYQNSLCPCDGIRVAMPGFSNHQMGLAIDFAGLPSTAGPVPGNPIWDWLTKNAAKYGYKNYPAEAWHWSPTGN